MAAAIGNRAHAQVALDLEMNSRKSAKGWKRCGQGASRSAWLHEPSGVVYKVERWTCGNNEAEYKNARECAKLEWERVRIPKVSMFKFKKKSILAMEYVDGVMGESVPRGSLKKARKELYEKGGFEDMHGLNFVITKDKKIVPIDMGSVRHGKGYRSPDDRLLTCGDGKLW